MTVPRDADVSARLGGRQGEALRSPAAQNSEQGGGLLSRSPIPTPPPSLSLSSYTPLLAEAQPTQGHVCGRETRASASLEPQGALSRREML